MRRLRWRGCEQSGISIANILETNGLTDASALKGGQAFLVPTSDSAVRALPIPPSSPECATMANIADLAQPTAPIVQSAATPATLPTIVPRPASSPTPPPVAGSSTSAGPSAVGEALTASNVAGISVQGYTFSVHFSPDGRYVATAGCSGDDFFCALKPDYHPVVRLWDLQDGGSPVEFAPVLPKELDPERDRYSLSTVFSASGHSVAAQSLIRASDGKRYFVNAWDVASHRALGTAISARRVLAFLGDRELVLSDGANQIFRWNLVTDVRGPSFDIDAPTNSVDRVAASSDGSIVAVPNGSDVSVWSVASGTRVQLLHRDGIGPVNAVGISPAADLIAALSASPPTMTLWRSSGEWVGTVPTDASLSQVTVSSDMALVFGVSVDSGIRNLTVFAWNAADLTPSHGPVRIPASGHYDLNADTGLFATLNEAGHLELWDLNPRSPR
jgi:WD40 repeat protein